jgi:hypothetical protein
VTDRANRRFALVHLVLVAECRRAGRRTQRRWADVVLPLVCAQVGCEWTGSLDLEWVRSELHEVTAEPGEYIEESYERWRLNGLPIWAAVAAGLSPTDGSRKILGRRPSLP